MKFSKKSLFSKLNPQIKHRLTGRNKNNGIFLKAAMEETL